MTAPQVIDSTRTPQGDTITTVRCANGKTKFHFDLAAGSSFQRTVLAEAKKAGQTPKQWITNWFKAEVARLKALEAEPLNVSAKSTAAFVAAAQVLGVTPAEVAAYLIGSVCRDLDDPTHGLLSDMAAGRHIPLARKDLPAVRERFLKWATARKMPRKRAVSQLAAAAA